MSDTPTAEQLYSLVRELFPICRSITGDGVRRTFERIRKEIPILLHEVPSGTRCFDWTIPDEWSIRDAYVRNSKGDKIIDFKKLNLHVVSYSIPFRGKVSLSELKKHLHTLPERPKAVPYVTSYYLRDWGFCISQDLLEQLPEDTYEVVVDSELKPGFLTMADLVIPGESRKEILLSTYICHPSMVNNELSGPVVATYLAKYILNKKNRRYSYRFVFVPETIGTIAYLSRNLKALQERVIAGYILTCLAGKTEFNVIRTRPENTLVDRLTAHVLKHSGYDWESFAFTERGSDERQYGWPGVDIPVTVLMRSSFSKDPSYHSSDDCLERFTGEQLTESLALYKKCIDAFEMNQRPLVTTTCEPFLSKHGLYRSLSTREYPLESKLLFNVLGYSDGKQDLIAIADRLNRPIDEVYQVVEKCKTQGLIVDIGEAGVSTEVTRPAITL